MNTVVNDLGIAEQDWQNVSNNCDWVNRDNPAQVCADFLDQEIPLDGANHTQVRYYTIEIPMRYAACFAVLDNGRKVRLKDSGKFLGWSGWQRKRSYLFKTGKQYLELKTDPDQATIPAMAGNVSGIILGTPVSDDYTSEYFLSPATRMGYRKNKRLNEERKFIGKDGEHVLLPAGSLLLRELAR